MPHRDYTEVLSFWRRTADDARRLQSQVDAVFRERDDAYKERDVLRKEVAALRAQINCNAETHLVCCRICCSYQKITRRAEE